MQTKEEQQRKSVFDAGEASGARLENHLRLKREAVVVERVERLDEQLSLVTDVVHEATIYDEVLQANSCR